MRRHSLTRSGIVKGVGTAGNARVERGERRLEQPFVRKERVQEGRVQEGRR